MFGYIKINKMDMTFREYEIYKSMYCGICKHIKREYGEVARFTINYDITFLELLLSSVYNVDEDVFREACIANPIQKKRHMINVFSEYASAMNILLAYYNIEDDVEDDKRSRDLLAKVAFKNAFKKAKKKYEKKAEFIEEKLKELKELEKNRVSNTDILSNVFGEILREVFDFDVSGIELLESERVNTSGLFYQSFDGLEDGDEPEDKDELEKRRILVSDVGFNLGKYIYILDAFEDMKRDSIKGSFNPFNIVLSINSLEDYEDFLKSKDLYEFIKKVDRKLAMIMSKVSISLDNLKISTNLGIIENIVYSGVCMNFGRLVFKMKEVEDEQ